MKKKYVGLMIAVRFLYGDILKTSPNMDIGEWDQQEGFN